MEGDESAIGTLQARYKKLIAQACTNVFRQGGLYAELSFDYKELIPDIESIVWARLISDVRDGTSNLANAPGAIIRTAARNKAIDFTRKALAGASRVFQRRTSHEGEHTQAETAAELGISVKTVFNELKAARGKFDTLFQED